MFSVHISKKFQFAETLLNFTDVCVTVIYLHSSQTLSFQSFSFSISQNQHDIYISAQILHTHTAIQRWTHQSHEWVGGHWRAPAGQRDSVDWVRGCWNVCRVAQGLQLYEEQSSTSTQVAETPLVLSTREQMIAWADYNAIVRVWVNRWRGFTI